MRILSHILLSVALLLGAGREILAQHDPNFCTLTPPTGTFLPQAPKSFNVGLVLSDLSGRRTSASEVLDGDAQKSTFNVYAYNIPYRAIVNFATNQVQVINLNRTAKIVDSCDVQNVSSTDILVLVTLGPSTYILPSKLFFGGGAVNVVSNGQETLPNGQAVNTYSSCYYWAFRNRSLKIKWHFLQRSPTTPYRVVIESQDNANLMKNTTTFDIFSFRAGLTVYPSRFNPFMAPPGVYCRGLRSQGRAVQTVPDKFSMRIERVPLGSNKATYMREGYDFKANMSLMVGYPPDDSGEAAKYGDGLLMYIHDFNRRLAYIRNEDMGNCTYARLSSSDWDAQKDGNKLRIRTPREFFDLDSGNVQYKGTGYTRDILTDIFISYKQINIGDDDLPLPTDTTIEWYFANKTTTDPDSKKTVIQSIPLSALVSSEASWLSAWLYIYDFEQKDLIFNRHDIAACFNNDAKRHFQLYFPLTTERVSKYVAGNPNEFTRLLIPIIALGLNVSPLRVLDPEVSVRDKTAILELTVTEKPKFQTDAEETPLKEIEAAFNVLLKQSSLFTALIIDDNEVLLIANKVTVVEERTSNLKSIGYSAGAVAGAAVGLLLAGLLAGLIAAFLFWR